MVLCFRSNPEDISDQIKIISKDTTSRTTFSQQTNHTCDVGMKEFREDVRFLEMILCRGGRMLVLCACAFWFRFSVAHKYNNSHTSLCASTEDVWPVTLPLALRQQVVCGGKDCVVSSLRCDNGLCEEGGGDMAATERVESDD